jgi:hypothetical protein
VLAANARKIYPRIVTFGIRHEARLSHRGGGASLVGDVVWPIGAEKTD